MDWRETLEFGFGVVLGIAITLAGAFVFMKVFL